MAKKSKLKKTRSRKVYPYYGLRTCVDFIEKLYKKDGLAEVPKELAWEHMGLDKSKNTAFRASSAMAGFGLLTEKVLANEKVLQLSDLGKTIVLASDNSTSKIKALQSAAFSYQIVLELVKKWPETLPADDAIKVELVVKRKFPERGARHFVEALRETYEFAKLGAHVIIEEEQTMNNNLKKPIKEKPMEKELMEEKLLGFEKYEITLEKGKEVKVYATNKLTKDDLNFLFTWLKRSDIVEPEENVKAIEKE